MESQQNEGLPDWVIYLLTAVGFVYLLNPTFGLLELIPDTIPIIGNLDEGAAALLVWQGISRIRDRRRSKRK